MIKVFRMVDGLTPELEGILLDFCNDSYEYKIRNETWSLGKFLNKVLYSGLFTSEQYRQINYEMSVEIYVESPYYWTDTTDCLKDNVYDENTLYEDLCSIKTLDEKMDYLEKHEFHIDSIEVFKQVFNEHKEVPEAKYLDYIIKRERYPVKLCKEYWEHVDFLQKYDEDNHDSLDKLYYLLKGINSNLSEKELIYIAEQHFDVDKLDLIIKWAVDYGLDEHTKIMFEKVNLSPFDIKGIKNWKDKHYSKELITLLENRVKLEKTILEIVKAVDQYGLSYEQIKGFDELDYSYEQINCLAYGMSHGYSEQQLSLFRRKDFSCHQITSIGEGFECGLTYEQVMVYSRPEMHFVVIKNFNNVTLMGLPTEYIQKLALKEMNGDKNLKDVLVDYQMKKLTEEQIKLYADSKMSEIN